MSLRCEVAPADGVDYNLAGVLSAASSGVCAHLFARRAAARLDVILSELVGNAIEHAEGRGGALSLRVSADPQRLEVSVANRVSPRTCGRVRAQVRAINGCGDPRALLAATMRRRRAEGRVHGLGLIRLASETRARLSVSFDRRRGIMRVRARAPLGGR
jgi:hypothetical protein